MRRYYVYILASRSRRLYVGVTNSLIHRLSQHRAGECDFTRRYRIQELVYVETTGDVHAAIAREKQMKSWSRIKKVQLIATMNPCWVNLAEAWGLLGDIPAPSRLPGDPSLRSG